MPISTMKIKQTQDAGFSLIELMVAVFISSIAAMAILPALNNRFRQGAVDSYTQKLEAGLTQLKANMIGRQDSCIIHFPNGAGSEQEFSPNNIDQFVIKEEISSSDDVDCPKPSNMGNKTMATTELRLINIKGSQNDFDNSDIKILISPDSIAINTVGGVTAPNPSYNNKPLTIRIRSDSLHQKSKGLERCIVMQPTTGEITNGTWLGTTFSDGQCTRSI